MNNDRDFIVPPALAEEHNDLADLAVQLANDELPPERATELRKRLETDPVFRAVAEPILEAWKEPALTDEEMAREWPEFRRLAGIADLEQLETRDDPELAAYAARFRERTRAEKWRRVLGVAALVLLVVGMPMGYDAYDERFNWKHIQTSGIATTTARLPDSTRVTLHPDSKLSYPSDMSRSANRTLRLRGRVDFDTAIPLAGGARQVLRGPSGDSVVVYAASSSDPPLEIHTASARITPFPARATVIADGDSTVVVVLMGTVLANARDDDGEPLRQSLRVEEGQRAVIRDGVVTVRQQPQVRRTP